MKQNAHGRLIAAAARAHLLPLGCRRRGQSRFWSADHGFWQIGIEFQPSGWSKGSYLNVGVQWLWYPKPYFTFDAGYRVADFVTFVDEVQFAPEADRLAARAAEEVRVLRERFHSLPAIAHHLETTPPHHNTAWAVYHVAVAAGLAGDVLKAHNLFDRLLKELADRNRPEQQRAVAERLVSCVSDTAAYRRAVLALVEECRALQRLAPGPIDLDDPVSAS